VDNRLNVTLIDSHREGDSADENTGSVLNEILLDEGSLLVCLSSVIGCRIDTLLVQIGRYLFTRTSGSSEDKDRRDLLEGITFQ
jgi:hypothetical protein